MPLAAVTIVAVWLLTFVAPVAALTILKVTLSPVRSLGVITPDVFFACKIAE
jgi:hypothetical protein